jgi:hypothetical protein
MPVESPEKLIGELWLIEGGSPDEQIAVPDHISLDTPLNREKAQPNLVGSRVLLGKPVFDVTEGQVRAALMFPQELKIPGSVLSGAQTQRKPLGLDRERHRSVRTRHC